VPEADRTEGEEGPSSPQPAASGGGAGPPPPEEPEIEAIGGVEPPPIEQTKGLPPPEATRIAIVLVLLGIFAGTIILPFIFEAVCTCSLSDKHWEYLKIVLSALAGLLGSAVAFYFGAASRST